MKRINSLILAAIFLTAGIGSAFAASNMSRGEREAQSAVSSFLAKKGYATKIDNTDNSVNFQHDSNIYWITFEEAPGAGILYTLHRRPIKMESPNENAQKNKRRLENAVFAANMMNELYPYKTNVSDDRVDFSFPVYANSPEGFTDVFPTLLKTLSNAKDEFDKCYDRALAKTDAMRTYWAENNPKMIVVPQPKNGVKPNTQQPNLTISSLDFRILDDKGNVVKNYGDNLRKADMQFLQPKITVSANAKGVYELGVVITTPNGKILIPEKGTDRTIVTTAEIDKKPKEVEFDKFGTKDGSIWVPGEYTVTFYEGHFPIETTTFNIL